MDKRTNDHIVIACRETYTVLIRHFCVIGDWLALGKVHGEGFLCGGIIMYLIPNLFYIDTGPFLFRYGDFLGIQELAYDDKSARRC